MESQEILGLVVNSDKHFDWVVSLTEAARAKGKVVKIHMVGEGVTLINFNGCALLSRMASITICAASLDKWGSEKMRPLPDGAAIVPPQQLAAFLQVCKRYVVF